MNAIARIFLACIGLGLAGLSAAADPTTQPAGSQPAATRVSPELVKHIQHQLQDVTTVEADFVELKNLAVLNHTLTIRGHMALEKPGKFIWIVREPVRYAIRLEDDEVRQWDEDTDRVDVIRLGGDPTYKAISDQMRAWFLGNYGALAKDYEVDVLSENPLSLRFEPQADSVVAKFMQRIVLTFAADQRYIEKMVVSETGGDTTTLEFVHTQLNQPVKDDIWRMPPNER
ncbi:MAG: outer membrane lipoprotein carrier protein LolA [Tepidisphaeraceae bacterium]